MQAAFITVGDTSRLTGGYLYHARVFDRLGEYGVEVEEIVQSGASVSEQKAGVSSLAAFDPREYDIVVVDALARIVCAPFIEGWRNHRPVVAMVHELPSLAAPGARTEVERASEDALLGADMFIAVSGHGKRILEGRGVPSGRVRVVSPGFDGFNPEAAARRVFCDGTAPEDGGREVGGRNFASREPVPREDASNSDSVRRGKSFRSSDPIRDARWDASTTGNVGRVDAETRCRSMPHPPGRDAAAEDAGRDSAESEIPSPANSSSANSSSANSSSANSDPLRVICVAQWIPRKGVLDLVEAWRSLGTSNASLHLVGETDADPGYRSRVMEAIGGDSSIRVSGALDDESLASAYAQSDIFVLPSRYEGYGIVFAEALSFGLPVVACDAGPVPEVVGREAGIFASPEDVPGISAAMHILLSDGNLRCRMSEAALRRVESLPRWDDTARGFAEVLWEAVGDG